MLVRAAMASTPRACYDAIEPVEKPVPGYLTPAKRRSFWLLVVELVVAVAGLAAVFVH